MHHEQKMYCKKEKDCAAIVQQSNNWSISPHLALMDYFLLDLLVYISLHMLQYPEFPGLSWSNAFLCASVRTTTTVICSIKASNIILDFTTRGCVRCYVTAKYPPLLWLEKMRKRKVSKMPCKRIVYGNEKGFAATTAPSVNSQKGKKNDPLIWNPKSRWRLRFESEDEQKTAKAPYDDVDRRRSKARTEDSIPPPPPRGATDSG